jgi:transposase InsO family protein
MMENVLQFVFLVFAGWVNRRQQDVIEYLKEENRVLREHLGERKLRFTSEQRIRLATKAKAVGRKGLMEIAAIVTPDTILRWYRQLIEKKYDGSKGRRTGRPKTKEEFAKLVVKMAKDNPCWGYTTIRNALDNIGISIARTTIKTILGEHGIVPAPERRKRTPWKAFLKVCWEGLAAADFFTVEVLSLRGLVRYHVFFVMELRTRRVKIAGMTSQPNERWMMQLARNLTDVDDGFLKGKTHLILDRDPLYTAALRRMLRDEGVKAVRLPARSPNLNAHAERFVLSVKSGCLSRMIPLGEKHLRAAISEYLIHYHAERPHQGLEHRILIPDDTAGRCKGKIVCRERLGGMLRYYHRKAA